ncbi:ephrin type-A receptor 1 isoform X4 [Eublepharis macularius]|uniref:Ephrin type-A receptor 1 n=1 Tax=Eublepharis macularius TaxID=481883 RepID=A0AA97LK39_EUBMA|nr:ephrin type-A receptor 1 isoform X4 [Eublepharis macularius]
MEWRYPGCKTGFCLGLLLLLWASLPHGIPGKEVNLLDTSTAQSPLGWLPNPKESGWGEVQQMFNGTPVYMYQDCSVFSEGHTDHWLRTNWIIRGEAPSRIYVELKFTVRDCKSFKDEDVVSCKETFNLYYMESDQDVGIHFHRPLFAKVNTVAGDRSFTNRDIERGALQLNTEVSPIGNLQQRGFYLAFQNSGACVALVSVRVYYKTCSKTVRGLAQFPETIASSEGLAVVPGACLENATEEVGLPPRMHCSPDGEWLVLVGHCLCAPGFEEAGGSCVPCQPGFHRHSLESKQCLKCPPNSSSSSPGATACPCLKDFFRAPTEDQTVGCTPPIMVSYLRMMKRNDSSLSLTWQAPPVLSQNSVSFEVMYFEKGEEKQYTVQHLQEPQVTLVNLQPDTAYVMRVRSITPFGHGPFSQAQEFRTLPQDTGVPAGGVIVSITFGVLLFIGLVVGLVIFRRRHAHRHRARPSHNHSGYDRDEIWLKPYVDLQPYEDPSRGVLEFTKELDPSLVNIETVIGEGEFGEVYRGTLHLAGKERGVVAIKTLKSSYSDSTWWNFLREATIMGQFNHPNIVRLEGVVTKRNPMMIITEYMENGALDTFLRENVDKFSPVQLVTLLQGIASGMTYLSDRNYVHRDLAARNILVSHNLQCKVSDFGLSRILENDVEGTYETKGGKIPIRWTAPEAIAHRIFTSASDVWSFGIVTWEVFSYGDKPYGDMSNQEVMKSIEDGYRLPPPVDCPSILYELMKVCWSYDRARRPRFREIHAQLEHFIASPHLLRTVADFDPRVTLRLPSCSGSDGIPYRSIPEWLESIRMKRYIINFRTAGLNTMESVLELSAEDLKQMGVTLPGHQKRILCSIQGFKE